MLIKKKIRGKFERNKPHCNVGTIGHVDHGKTTLTAAITKCLQNIGCTVFKSYSDIDSNIEERLRGITINASHIEYETEKRHYSHIDCPGHQQYIRHMLMGAIQMEGAILVVSVNDGPQVQTREHVILAREVGIAYMIVYINKLDTMQEPDLKDLVELEARELLETYQYATDLPVIKGSARTALNEDYDKPSELGLLSVKALMEAVDNYIPQPTRRINEPFLLSIESVHVITGRGTVVTGQIEQGILKENDELELLGKDIKKTICLGMETYHKTLTVAEVGDNVGILIKNIKKDQVKRGYVLCAPGTMKLYKSFEAKIYIMTKAEGGRHKPFVTGYKPQFFFRTCNITGAINITGENSVAMPGDTLIVNIYLSDFCPLNKGLKFVMRESTITIGAGVITELK
jgi:elongation factor Tu